MLCKKIVFFLFVLTFKTIFVHKILRTCIFRGIEWMWVNWSKNMCFWRRFTCTDHKPPIFTRKDEACNGTKIENAQETAQKLQLAHNETIQYLTKQHNNTKKHLMETNTEEKEKLTGNWTAYTVVAIFITLVLTVLVTVTVIKMCFP